MLHPLLNDAQQLLHDAPFPYAICGGWAIDLFCGRQTRPHGDIDLMVFHEDRQRILHFLLQRDLHVYEMLGGGKVHRLRTPDTPSLRNHSNLFACTPDCELVRLYDTDTPDVFWLNFQHTGIRQLNYIEFLFNDADGASLFYANRRDISLPLDSAILHAGELPYLAPEMCLLYKSTELAREGYQQDHDLALQSMSDAQRKWLRGALLQLYPQGHPWQ